MDHQLPELRTNSAFAITLCVLSLFAVVVTLTIGGSIEDSLGSHGLAVAILALWCVAGFAAGIAGVVDAYVKPEGETLGLAVSIAATVFGVLAMIVIVALVFTVGSSFTGFD